MRPHANPDSTSPARPAALNPSRTAILTGRARRASAGSLQLARLEAAAALIGDESPAVRRALAHEFLRAARVATPILRRAARSDDARVRSHARALLDDSAWETARRRLARYIVNGELDFEAGLWRLSALERPSFDARPYRKALDAMAREVGRRCTSYSDPLDSCKVLVDYIGHELGFAGDLESYTSPDNVYLHRVIERKQGLPLSLCAIYSFVARRCGLRTALVPLPGHVMLRLYGRRENLIVDPFHGGEARTQESLMKYLQQHGLKFKPVWFQLAPDPALLRRHVANLRGALLHAGRSGRARSLVPLLDLFDAR